MGVSIVMGVSQNVWFIMENHGRSYDNWGLFHGYEYGTVHLRESTVRWDHPPVQRTWNFMTRRNQYETIFVRVKNCSKALPWLLVF